MKEIILRETPEAVCAIPESDLSKFKQLHTALKSRSTIAWGEHCSECAFPSCYSSCEFYTPRQDMHCRRFANGIEKVITADAARLSYMTQIQFRRWGKLEGSGPVKLLPTGAAAAKEARANSTAKLLSALPLPKRIASSLTFRANDRMKSATLLGNDEPRVPDSAVFVIEGWLEHDAPVTMTIAIMPWDKSVEGLFQKEFTFRQGYNREIINISAIRQSTSIDIPFALQIEVVGDPPTQPVIFGLVDFALLDRSLLNQQDGQPAKGAASKNKSKTAKCVVWDLDDTVWTGTLVEDGIEGVQLKPGILEAMQMLDSRGILNSVASKNDAPLALAALDHFKLREYILFPQITWDPKSDSIRRIAEAIDIGLDTFVFVDDQPFERGEVSAAHPSVTVVSPEAIQDFATNPLFDVPVTAESKQRRLMYRDEEKRQAAATNSSTDYIGFLRSCSIELTVLPVTEQSAERVYELTQRTNQLNVTGARYSREEVRQFIDGTCASTGYVLRCKDTFGDYGIIGFCAVDINQATVSSYFMSCRVQRKKVEQAFFAWLAAKLVSAGKEETKVSYRKTQKNIASVNMFKELGFTLHESQPGEGHFTRSNHEAMPNADVVKISVTAGL